METSNWEMNTYSPEDFKRLLETLIDPEDNYRSVFDEEITQVTVEGQITWVTHHLLLGLSRNEPFEKLISEREGHMNSLKLYEIIYWVPFEEIPLHLMDFPEIVKWRLSIGK
jgi:hypothetical protein